MTEARSAGRDVVETQSPRVPLGQAIAYGAGVVPGQVAEHAILFLANPVYCVLLGISPVLVGNVLSCTRLVDAVLEPWLANLSDNSRSRWGRRRPFVVAGGLTAMLCVTAVFCYPVSFAATGYGWWFAAWVAGFYVGYAAYCVGYNSLLPELAASSAQRGRVLGIQATIRTLAVLATVWALPVAQSKLFPDVAAGLHSYGLVLAGLSLAGILATILRIKENTSCEDRSTARMDFRDAIRQTLRIRAIYPLIVTQILLGMGAYLTSAVIYYLLVFYVCRGDFKAGSLWQAIISSTWLGTSLILTTPLVEIMRRVGRDRMFQWLSAAMMASALLGTICYFPGATWSVCIPTVLMAPSWTVVQIIVTGQGVDLTEWDELQTGRRREAMVLSIVSLVNKGIFAATFTCAGYLLLLSGFDVSKGVAQAEGVYRNMLAGVAGIPFLCIGIALFSIRKFPITEARAKEIRDEVVRRRSESNPLRTARVID